MTYPEIDGEADALAARLRAFVQVESVVAILLPRNSHHAYVAQLAVLKAGAAHTCIDPAFPDEHIRSILEDSEAVALLTDRDGLARATSLEFPVARVIDVVGKSEAATDGPDPTPPPRPGPASLAYLIYTSGTTGRPKGVMIEHRSISNLVGSDIETFGLTPDDRVAQSSSTAYDSSMEEIWLAFAVGATLVVIDDDTARLGPDLVPWLRRERVTVFCPTPTLLRTMGCDDPGAALPDLRLLYTGGEALSRDLAEQWAPGRWMENGYGPTECTVTVVRGRVRAGSPVAIGRPVRGHRAWVLDDSLEEVPDGEAGELCLGGIGIARGYRSRPSLTAEKFPIHPRFGRIFRTGDLARRDRHGDLHCLGRIDSQVKLRGYRIELAAIETRLMECPGVREAACRLQGEGREGALVAFVVPEDAGAPPNIDDLQASLRRSLPAYMVPSRFGFLPRLPTTVGGKIDRAALSDIDAPRRGQGQAVIAPRDEIERRIRSVFGEVLEVRDEFSIHDDFFDLGGDSLAAAGAISALRDDAATASLTVRDIYEARTVAAMAERARSGKDAEEVRSGDPSPPRGRPLLVTAAQGAWILVGIVLVAAVLYLAGFHLLPYVVSALGIIPFLLIAPPAGFVALILYAPFALGWAVLVKKLLIGTYRPMRAPVWGSFYLRNWVVQKSIQVVPWSLLQGTVLLNVALRALGARIGRRVHIHRGVDLLQGGWDLLEIGDDVTLCQDASVRLVDLEDGHLIVGPVKIGDGSTIDVRAGVSGGAVVGSGAFLSGLSWLPGGERIPDGERWDGVPAKPAGLAPPPPPLPETGRILSPIGHGVLLTLARFGSTLVALAPLLLLAIGLTAAYGLEADRAMAWLFGPSLDPATWVPLLLIVTLAVPLTLLLQGLCLRWWGPIGAGSMSRWSQAYLRVLVKVGVVRSAGEWLSGTLFWPRWLRLAGMRIGAQCEISSMIDVVPERIEIGDESFFADGIYLGCPRVHRNVVTVSSTKLGRNTFLGNHAIIPAGQEIPEGVLIGVCTTVGDAAIRPGSSWFGHPAFELPRREVVECDRRLTHDPGLVRYLTRLLWESSRFLLPAVPLMILIGWFKVLWAVGAAAAWPVRLLILAPAVTFGAAALSCLLVLALKWFLLGRVRPGQHPLWSCWCSRWDFLYMTWMFYARRILSTLEGTLFLAWFLRAMGARVGRRVVLGGGFAQVVDPDMLHLEDGATVSCMFQAHSFEDRVLKIDRVRIRRGASLGRAAVLFYGADVGARTWVSPHSVVMKRERLLPGRSYAGCPTRPC